MQSWCERHVEMNGSWFRRGLNGGVINRIFDQYIVASARRLGWQANQPKCQLSIRHRKTRRNVYVMASLYS